MTGGPQPRDGLHRSLSPPRRSNSPHVRPRYPAISDVRSRVIRYAVFGRRYRTVSRRENGGLPAGRLAPTMHPPGVRGRGEWYRACGTRRRVFTIEQIDQLHGRLGNAETQSDYVLSLVALGVARYDSFVSDGHSEYVETTPIESSRTLFTTSWSSPRAATVAHFSTT